MTIEPTYEDVDETGEVSVAQRNKLMQEALAPKTPLQIKLLATSGSKRFASTSDRSRWRKLEPKGSGPDQQLRIAWLEHCIDWGMKKKGMPYTAVIAYAENTEKERLWIMENKAKVLRKKSVGEVKEVLEAKLDAIYNED